MPQQEEQYTFTAEKARAMAAEAALEAKRRVLMPIYAAIMTLVQERAQLNAMYVSIDANAWSGICTTTEEGWTQQDLEDAVIAQLNANGFSCESTELQDRVISWTVGG